MDAAAAYVEGDVDEAGIAASGVTAQASLLINYAVPLTFIW